MKVLKKFLYVNILIQTSDESAEWRKEVFIGDKDELNHLKQDMITLTYLPSKQGIEIKYPGEEEKEIKLFKSFYILNVPDLNDEPNLKVKYFVVYCKYIESSEEIESKDQKSEEKFD